MKVGQALKIPHYSKAVNVDLSCLVEGKGMDVLLVLRLEI